MPLVMSKEEWARLGRRGTNERDDNEMERRREYIQYLSETSKEMTKSWPNSLENVNKRNEELRLARIATAEQANTKFYNKYVKRKKEERERMMFSARDTVFKNKDAPKLLLSAVIETVIQKERSEQVKFNKKLREMAAEQKRKDEEEIVKKSKEWHELQKGRRKTRFERDKQYQKELLEQAHEISERNRKEYETELNMQILDNIQAKQQMEALREFEENFKAAERARIFSDMEQAKKENEQRKKEREARDSMDDRLLEVLSKSRARVEKRRKQTEIDVRKEKLRVLEQISSKLESGDAARNAKEQAMHEKAKKEKEEIDDARLAAIEAKREKFRKEKKEQREQFLRDEEQRLHEVNTMRQWELMNRFKNQEIYDDYQKKIQEERRRTIKEYREDILKLWKEREDREARERAETRYFYGELALRKLRDADNKVLTHAAELLREAKENDRPDYALHKAIDRYCKLYRLYPMPDLPSSMQEHFKRYAPWDGSKPDADYREPPPPDSKLDEKKPKPETEQPPAPPPHSDGLQELPSTSKATDTKPKETLPKVENVDYKRVGKANGLQRPTTNDTSLPPITVIPCPNADCNCEMKK